MRQTGFLALRGPTRHSPSLVCRTRMARWPNSHRLCSSWPPVIRYPKTARTSLEIPFRTSSSSVVVRMTAYTAAPYDETAYSTSCRVARVTGHADLAGHHLVVGIFNCCDGDHAHRPAKTSCRLMAHRGGCRSNPNLRPERRRGSTEHAAAGRSDPRTTWHRPRCRPVPGTTQAPAPTASRRSRRKEH